MKKRKNQRLAVTHSPVSHPKPEVTKTIVVHNWFDIFIRGLVYLTLLVTIFFIPIPATTFVSVAETPVPTVDFEIPIPDYPAVGTEKPPILSAKSYLVVDGQSAMVLAAKNSSEKLYPASLTKLMTALVALDYYSLDEMFFVKRLVTVPDESEMGLAVGDKLTVRDLIYGLLVPSGNDAAYALADNFPGGIENFIYAMNLKAKQLHMYSTHFNNPSGIDTDNHLTSAEDILLLARYSMKNPEIKQIVATSGIVLSDVDGKKHYYLSNVNKLLGVVNGLEGIKTGHTDLAGYCLVTSTTRKGHTIYTVVLNSVDRFGESASLINWAFRNTSWQKLTN